MPLTPEDVRNKQFRTVRLREGYDEDEVDAFLDEVEARPPDCGLPSRSRIRARCASTPATNARLSR